MIRLLSSVLFLTACAHQTLAQSSPASAVCAPAGFDRTDLDALKAAGFVIEDVDERQRFALGLIDCLDDADPEIRDGIAYEGLAALMRSDALQTDTLRTMKARLTSLLLPENPDPADYGKPFAVLVLSEVARTDRISAWMSDEERSELVEAGAAYLESIADYRGFDEAEGWRHGVAHSADMMLQLALNPALTRADAERIRVAIASQVAPVSGHFYIYGESQRLARPILFLARSGVFTEEEWSEWFAQFTSAGEGETWTGVFSSQPGLARLHNIKAFSEALLLEAALTENENIKRLTAGAYAVAAALP